MSDFTPHEAPIREAQRLPVPSPMKLVGRDPILAQVYGQLKENNPVLIYGESGVGKTAIAATLANAYAQLSTGERVKSKAATIRKRCRWLIPGDIAHFIANPKRFSLQPSFFKFFDKNTSYDQLQWKDFKGSFATLCCTFLQIFDLTIWKKGIFRNG